MPAPPFLDTALDLLAARVPDIAAVYLYGSHARGDATPESDFDLALLTAARPLAPLHRFELAQTLAVCLGCDVDLVDLRAVPTVMQMQVISTGQVVHDAAPSLRRHFETFVLSSYALLNEERRGIVQDVLQRGHVYGR